jgi:hypothetical protein
LFDLRYHAASLVAVFLALAVGVLLGVAISGKVSDTQESAQQAIIDQLNEDLDRERERTADAGRRGEAAERLVAEAYKTLMEGRLEGKRFAVLFLGGVDGELRSAVERALADAGSGAPLRMTALSLPIDPKPFEDYLVGRADLSSIAVDDVGDLGRGLAIELVEGGSTPLWNALADELVEERFGATFIAVDGAIVVRSWIPDTSGDIQVVTRRRASETLIDGLLDGLDGAGVPVVGVETASTAADESAIDLFRGHGISSVDDVDAAAGRLALALLLAGGEPGHYGIKESASDGVTPSIEPVAAEPVAS